MTFDIPVPGRPRDQHQSIQHALKPLYQCWFELVGRSGDLVEPRSSVRGRRGYSLDGRGRCRRCVLAAFYAQPEPSPGYSTSGTPPGLCLLVIDMQDCACVVRTRCEPKRVVYPELPLCLWRCECDT